MRARRLYRAATVLTAAVVGVALFAGPASAHVEVSADKPQAGATNVTLTFVGEAESSSGGIISERIVLPKGIKPSDVTLAKAPTGWKLTVNPDGVTVAGKALPIGKDATVAVKVTQLPADATQLAFKTVETYSDGKVSRWIGIQEKDGDEPDNPAPVLKLRAAAPTSATPSVAPTTAAATSAPPAAATTAATVQAVPVSSNDGGASWIVWVVGALIIVGVGAAVLVRRRRGAGAAG